ncbi:hypothetical protein [Wolbachia endosymbiont (group A) of Colletes cunicularius]|uniref:hypothetical protein n=1 Tax=Wolbachia endosymbiont (group A) of Colletes cunicularius TaxID=3139321 RepID=UPI0035C8A97A
MIFIDDSGVEDNRFYEYGWSQKGKRLFGNVQKSVSNRIFSSTQFSIYLERKYQVET